MVYVKNVARAVNRTPIGNLFGRVQGCQIARSQPISLAVGCVIKQHLPQVVRSVPGGIFSGASLGGLCVMCLRFCPCVGVFAAGVVVSACGVGVVSVSFVSVSLKNLRKYNAGPFRYRI